MLFEFELAPLESYTSAAHPANPELSWYALTQGEGEFQLQVHH